MIKLQIRNKNMILTEKQHTSALSTRKIDKYEFITGEEMLPLHQRRVTEQGKFTYSPSGKAFKEQIKTTTDQGEKQIKALEEHGKQLVKYNNEKESSIHLKQKQIFKELANNRMEKLQDLSKQIDFNNLTYRYKGNTAPKTIIGIKGQLGFYRNIKEVI